MPLDNQQDGPVPEPRDPTSPHLRAYRAHPEAMPAPEQLARELEGSTVTRTFQLDREAVDTEAGTVDLAFSSEAPVDRFWGQEILDHDARSVRLGRLNNAGAFLVQHDPRDHVGAVQTARIDDDRRGRARVLLGPSARAQEILADMAAGIRVHISVGYQIHRVRLEEEKDDQDGALAVYRVTDWEPLELSVVSIPADATVGVGRSAGYPSTEEQQRSMPDDNTQQTSQAPAETTPAAVRAAPEPISAEEQERQITTARQEAVETVTEILAYGARFNLQDLAQECLRDGLTLSQARGKFLLAIPEGAYLDSPASETGMSEKEARKFSFYRALNALEAKDWSNAGFELEAVRAVAQKAGRSARGFFLPLEVLTVQRGTEHMFSGLLGSRMAEMALALRDVSSGAPAQGANLIGTTHLAGSFIELLRNALMVRRLGARVLSGLVGDIEIPRQDGAGTATWIDNEAEGATASEQVYGSILMSPKTVVGKTAITRKMLLQSSPDVEALTVADLIAVLAESIDLASLVGSGAANQPRGITNTTGVGVVIMGDPDGGAPTWGKTVEFESLVTAANANAGNLAYVANGASRGKMKTTPKEAGYPMYLWPDAPVDANGFSTVNGYRAGVTNQLPGDGIKGTGTNLSTMIYGDWSQNLIAEWSLYDVKLDEITNADSGGLIVRCFADVDTAVRQPGAFSYADDISTA